MDMVGILNLTLNVLIYMFGKLSIHETSYVNPKLLF